MISGKFSRDRPEVVYTHNPADKHDTHIGVTIAALQAMRELPRDQRPQQVIGCEVWRNLDWLPDDQKVLMDVSGRDNLAAASTACSTHRSPAANATTSPPSAAAPPTPPSSTPTPPTPPPAHLRHRPHAARHRRDDRHRGLRLRIHRSVQSRRARQTRRPLGASSNGNHHPTHRRSATGIAARIIARLLREKPDAVLGLATGSTPLLLYRALIDMKLDWSRSPPSTSTNTSACRASIRRPTTASCGKTCFQHVNIRPENIHIPDGNAADIPAFCAAYEKSIRAAGGIDLQVLGIGTDGHIGFNEPTSSLASRTRIKTLTPQTRRDNARFFGSEDLVPHFTSSPWASAPSWKPAPISCSPSAKTRPPPSPAAVEGPVTSNNPASVLQLHPSVKVCLDEPAASQLERTDYYRWVYANKPAWQVCSIYSEKKESCVSRLIVFRAIGSHIVRDFRGWLMAQRKRTQWQRHLRIGKILPRQLIEAVACPVFQAFRTALCIVGRVIPSAELLRSRLNLDARADGG
jgi:glucosamine-6-phosphate deaminase